jgi:hypothetical protein
MRVSSIFAIKSTEEFNTKSSQQKGSANERSKIASRKYPPTNEKNARLQKGREFSASVPKGELTARAAKEDKNDTEVPSPQTQN